MHRALIAAAAYMALAAPALAETAKPTVPTSPDGWRAAAAKDLDAIHNILRDNGPAMVVARDSALFRSWLDNGLAQARADLPKVTDARGYYALLRGYVVGFRDSHIQWTTTTGSGVSTRALAWPGFVLGWDSRGYEVAYRSPDWTDAPPLHARFLGCDGKSAEAFAATHDRYDGDFNLASGRAKGSRGLMYDRGNPFVARPTACSFRAGREARNYRLDWRPLDRLESLKIDVALAGDAAGGELRAEP